MFARQPGAATSFREGFSQGKQARARPYNALFRRSGPLCEGAVSEADWGRETCRYFSTCLYRHGRTHPPAFAACLYILIYKGKPMPTKEAILIKTRRDPTGCAWLFFCSNIQGEQERRRKSGKKIKKTCKKVLTKQIVVAIIMRSSARAPGARNKILPHSSVG